jgi:hypothetical protein
VRHVAFLVVLLLAAPVFAAGRPVTFAAPDGTTLAGMFYEASPMPAPAVVLVHMLGIEGRMERRGRTPGGQRNRVAGD